MKAERNGQLIACKDICFTTPFGEKELRQLLQLAENHSDLSVVPFKVRFELCICARENGGKRRISIATNHATTSIRYAGVAAL